MLQVFHRHGTLNLFYNAPGDAIAAHEYGHHVNWRYSDIQGTCINGVDEAASTQEAVADVVSALFWMDDPQGEGTYGAVSGGTPTFPNHSIIRSDAHRNANSLITTDDVSDPCPFNRSTGEPFEQAMWEIMFNRDCEKYNCSSGDGHGSYLWPGKSREYVLTEVGDALAYALRLEGGSPTFEGIVDRFLSRIWVTGNNTNYVRIAEVFFHHGLL